MKKTLHISPLSISNIRGYLAILCLILNSFLTAQNTAIFKIYNQTVREGSAIGAFNNGNNYLINTCSGNQAQYLWTDAQGNLLDTQNDFLGSCGQYRYDVDNYIQTDSVGSSPNRDVRLTKMRRDGSTVWAKTYPLSMDNFGQFAVPTNDGGFLVAGATQVPNDSTYKIQLIKTDANGTLQWQKVVTQGLTYSRVRRPNPTSCYDIINGKLITITNAGQTSDGGFYLQYLTSEPSLICGSGGGNGAILIRLDANGNYLWDKSDISGATEGKSHKIAATENGNILLLYTRSAGDIRTCTSNEYKLIKLSATGATLWSFEKGGSTCSTDRPQLASAFGVFPNGDAVLETQGMTIFRKISGQSGLQIDSIIQTPIDSARGATSIATLADGTFAVTGYADGTSIWKTFFYKNKFNTPSVSTGYCASKGIAPWELWTRNVSFNTLNNTSDKYKDYATLGFSDYTNLSTTVNKGQSYPLSILPPVGWNGYFSNVFCRVWIDFNKNNIFEDTEKVLEGTNTNVFSANVLVPTTAATGAIRMRVSMKQGGYPTACETFDKGEVEDYTIQIGDNVSNTCFKKFALNAVSAESCFGYNSPNIDPFLFYSTTGELETFDLGFNKGMRLMFRQHNNYDLQINLFTQSPPSTIPPVGSKFRNCTTGNWLYFTMNGTGSDERRTYAPANKNVRVHYWGAINNPDSVFVEFDSLSNFLLAPLRSTLKTQVCNQCKNTDSQPPVFNCPTNTITFSQPWSPNQLRFGDIEAGTGVVATDNCSVVYTGFETLFNVYWGGIYPIKLTAYDESGHQSACSFNLRMPCPTNSIKPTFYNCPKDTILTITAAQTCVAYTWAAPLSNGAGSPYNISSNYQSGHCFPIGSTKVIYYLTDSCGGRDTCSFVVTINGGTSNNLCASKSVAPWELWTRNVTFNTINNTSDKYKDYATLGFSDYTNLSTTVNKGQSYPLSISPPTGWNGYFSNVFCRVWIDFNKNNIFDDNEKVLEQTNANAFATNILIPTTAATGSVRMRVSMKWGGYPTACETFDKGEVEDYILNIAGGTTSNLPDLTISFSSAYQCGGTHACTDGFSGISVRIKNQGTAAAAATSLKFYQSADETFDASDTPLLIGSKSNPNTQCGGLPYGAEILIPNLAAGATLDTFIYAGQPSNVYWIAKTDANNTVAESAENNNTFSQCYKPTLNSITTTIGQDTFRTNLAVANQLQIVYLAAINPYCLSGANFISLTNTQLAYYLSTDTVLSADDITIPFTLTGTLNFGIHQTDVNIPNSITSGVYYLFAKATVQDICVGSPNTRTVFRRVVVINSSFANTNDIALNIASTPSVFTKYAPLNFTISAKNTGNQAFTNVKIEFKFPTNTTNGGTATPSVGTWQEWCAGGVQCFTWTIPTLAANSTATLTVPVYVLGATGGMVATTTLLSSTPVDATIANNTATITVNPSVSAAPQASSQQKPTQLIPIVIQKLGPNPSDSDLNIEIESLDEREAVFQFSNAFGQVIFSEKKNVEKGINHLQFDVSALLQGAYFIQLSTNEVRHSPAKFLKM